MVHLRFSARRLLVGVPRVMVQSAVGSWPSLWDAWCNPDILTKSNTRVLLGITLRSQRRNPRLGMRDKAGKLLWGSFCGEALLPRAWARLLSRILPRKNILQNRQNHTDYYSGAGSCCSQARFPERNVQIFAQWQVLVLETAISRRSNNQSP